MKTTLDCLSCFVRQTLEVARLVSPDPTVHEKLLRDVLRWASEMDLNQPPPAMGQRIHRRLRKLTGIEDIYREAKQRFTRMALHLVGEWEKRLAAMPDPLETAVRLAIAANLLDLGAKTEIEETNLPNAFEQDVHLPLAGDMGVFREALRSAGRILYLADNAGEIVFDRLLIEHLSPPRVTVAVRGVPVINDATLADAEAAGLTGIVTVVANGSDAPGTILTDCSPEFRTLFDEADLVVAKGQGNYETLATDPKRIFFLFKVKCPIVASHCGLPLGSQAVLQSRGWESEACGQELGFPCGGGR